MMAAYWKARQAVKANGGSHISPTYGGNIVVESIGGWDGTRIVVDEHYKDLPNGRQDILEGITGMHNQADDNGYRTIVTAYICHRNGDPDDITNSLLEVMRYDGTHDLEGRKEIFTDPVKTREVITWIAEEMVAEQSAPIPI